MLIVVCCSCVGVRCLLFVDVFVVCCLVLAICSLVVVRCSFGVW